MGRGLDLALSRMRGRVSVQTEVRSWFSILGVGLSGGLVRFVTGLGLMGAVVSVRAVVDGEVELPLVLIRDDGTSAVPLVAGLQAAVCSAGQGDTADGCNRVVVAVQERAALGSQEDWLEGSSMLCSALVAGIVLRRLVVISRIVVHVHGQVDIATGR